MSRPPGAPPSGSGSAAPLVKVIVPCYGYADLLEGCVSSVLGQRGVEVRVLIVDDCSPDHTEAVAARIAAADGRVSYRRHDRNQGLTATANEGLAWARDGDCTLLLSADDRLVPGALGRAARVLAEHPGVGMVYGRAPCFGADPAPRPGGRYRGARVWSGPDWIRRRCRSAHNCISSPEAVVRTAVQSRVGGYDPACLHAGDLNMWLRIAAVSEIAFVRGAPQALYRVHAGSMLRSDPDPLLDLTERRTAFERFFAGAGGALPGAGALRATVRRTLARQALWQASRAYDRGEVEGDGRALVGELVAFALATSAETERLREWHGLRLRQRIGSGRSIWFPPFLLTGAAHRGRSHAAALRRRLRGV